MSPAPAASSGGNVGGSGDDNFTNKLCPWCHRVVLIPEPTPFSEIICPICNSGWSLERSENPSPAAAPPPPPPPLNHFENVIIDTIFRLCPNGPLGVSTNLPMDVGFQFQDHTGSDNSLQDPPENPAAFLEIDIHNTTHVSNIHMLVMNNSEEGGSELASDPGDYFNGPGFEEFIQNLEEDDTTHYGTPPASIAAVEALPGIKITAELLVSNSSECAVCKEDFELDEDAIQMPCPHFYHPACLLPWLGLHNSCPICRYKLPTDDPDYENRKAGNLDVGEASGSSASSNGGESSENRHTTSWYRVPRTVWSAVQRVVTNHSRSGIRVINSGTASLSFQSLGTSSENPRTLRGVLIRISIPSSTLSRARPADNSGARNDASNGDGGDSNSTSHYREPDLD